MLAADSPLLDRMDDQRTDELADELRDSNWRSNECCQWAAGRIRIDEHWSKGPVASGEEQTQAQARALRSRAGELAVLTPAEKDVGTQLGAPSGVCGTDGERRPAGDGRGVDARRVPGSTGGGLWRVRAVKADLFSAFFP